MPSSPPVALVTGAAGGIGRATALALAAEGSAVAVLDRPGTDLKSTVSALEAAGADVLPVEADVTVAAEVDAAVALVQDALGPLTQLASVAGVLRTGVLLDTTDDDWALQMAVNATGPFHCLRAAGRVMAANGGGSVAVVSSNAAVVPRQNMLAYAASKAAATALTRCAGLELAEHGVRCNVVLPGSTDTAMLRSLWPDPELGIQASLNGVPESYRVGIPLRRVGTAQDVADLIAFLLSDRSSQITLQTIAVDGGASL
ncbi:SDR family oxidoreductase [Lentzea sp. NPDC058450]|uniref:SDR family oxidoreductase n=1 Tax=Lentzea sp. NPDC058450 TaxID=3346505 RepID=UPI00364A06D8